MKRISILLALTCLLGSCTGAPGDILIEAESFDEKGGWVIDNQSIMQMGSPYLLAHGLGIPVADARTSFKVRKAGEYHLWVRTRDWVKPWGKAGSPGRFEVEVNGGKPGAIFGTESAGWAWQDGGIISLKKGRNSIALHDLTGFDGRCDAICLSQKAEAPANDIDGLATLRRDLLRTGKPSDGGSYDLVVVGGGIAGCCAAVSAARLGCKVALVQNRPVLGGNNSSEVRVGLSGLIMQQPYPELGNLLDELGGVGHWTNFEAQQDSTTERSRQILEILRRHPEKIQHNAGPASNYEDGKKLKLIRSERNITLFLNTQVISAAKEGNCISYVIGKNIESGKEVKISGKCFADCTGDANLGFLAGADYRTGRESRDECGEPQAPEEADGLTMGTSVQWYAVDKDEATDFPECEWAMQFNDGTCQRLMRGDWNWEAGLGRDQVEEIEYIRDLALRAVYGNWSYLKNHCSDKEEYRNAQLEWVAYIGGKRESRRLMGDLILREQDLVESIAYEDASFTTTWGIDLHYPDPIDGMDEEPFLAYSEATNVPAYAVPYRCLYSRNVDNLFMAGRCISVTHIALGSVRVMRTGGMMGEVVGMAASICREHSALPRDVYESYLPELKDLMAKGTGKRGFPAD